MKVYTGEKIARRLTVSGAPGFLVKGGQIPIAPIGEEG